MTANPAKEMKLSAKAFAKFGDWFTRSIPDEDFKLAFRNQVREAMYDTLADRNQKNKPEDGFFELAVAVI